MEWQPIETAPKDGTAVILCSHVCYEPDGPVSKYNEIGVAAWRGGAWIYQADGNDAVSYMSDFGTEYQTFDVPSHWMPLPEPPK